MNSTRFLKVQKKMIVDMNTSFLLIGTISIKNRSKASEGNFFPVTARLYIGCQEALISPDLQFGDKFVLFDEPLRSDWGRYVKVDLLDDSVKRVCEDITQFRTLSKDFFSGDISSRAEQAWKYLIDEIESLMSMSEKRGTQLSQELEALNTLTLV